MAGTPVIRTAPVSSISGATFDTDAGGAPANSSLGVNGGLKNGFPSAASFLIFTSAFGSNADQFTSPGSVILGNSMSVTMSDDAVKGPFHCSAISAIIGPVTVASNAVSLYFEDGTNGGYWDIASSAEYQGGYIQAIGDTSTTPDNGVALGLTATLSFAGLYMAGTVGGESMFESVGAAISWCGREISVDGGTSTAGNEITFESISLRDRLTTRTTAAPFTGNFYGHVKEDGGLIKLQAPVQIGNADDVTVTYMLELNTFALWTDHPVNTKFYRLDIVGAATTVIFGDPSTPSPVIIDVAGSTLRWALDTSTDLPSGFNSYGSTFKRGRAWVLGSTTAIEGGVIQDVTDIAMNALTQITNTQLIKSRLDYTLPPATGKLTGSTLSSPSDFCMTVSTQQATMQIDYEFAASSKGAGKAIQFNHTSGNIELQFVGGVTPLVLADITISGAGTVTIPAAGATLAVKCVDTSGAAIQDARVRVRKTSDSAVVLNGLTDVNGDISTTYSFTADEAVNGWARKSSSAPLYKEGPINATITSSGFSSTVTMVSDE